MPTTITIPATAGNAAASQPSRKPRWMKQYPRRPNLPNKDSTERFLNGLKADLQSAQTEATLEARISVSTFSPQDEARLKELRKERQEEKSKILQVEEDLQDVRYEKGLLESHQEGLLVQLQELSLHEKSIHTLLASTEPELPLPEDRDVPFQSQGYLGKQQQQELDVKGGEEGKEEVRVEEESVQLTSSHRSFEPSMTACTVAEMYPTFSASGFVSTNTSQGLSHCGSTEDEERQYSNNMSALNFHSATATAATAVTNAISPSLVEEEEERQSTATATRFSSWIPSYIAEEEEVEVEVDQHDAEAEELQGQGEDKEQQQQQQAMESVGEWEETQETLATSTPQSTDSFSLSCPPPEARILRAASTEEAEVKPGRVLTTRQQHALAALPDVQAQVAVIRLNLMDIQAGLRRVRSQLKALNKMKTIHIKAAKELRREAGAIYYPYAAIMERQSKAETGRASFLESRIQSVQATYDSELACWEAWVQQAQAAYRKRNNLPDDYAMGYPGMPAKFEGRGSLAAILEALDEEKEYFGFTAAEVSSGLEYRH